jgi:hypothetical protein
MGQAVADFETWIAEVRDSLPLLKAKLKQSDAGVQRANFDATALRAEAHLFENILAHHDQLSRKNLGRIELLQVLDAIHHGVQGCAQHAINRSKNPDSDEDVFACLAALADIDQRIVGLGAKKPTRSERQTSD